MTRADRAIPDGALAQTLAALLVARAGGSVCPSEVARALQPAAADEPRGAERWRALMPRIHLLVAAARAEGAVETRWRGAARDPLAGPYRIHPPNGAGTGATGAE